MGTERSPAWLYAVIRALHAETKCRSTQPLRIQRQLTSDLSRFVRILHYRSESTLIGHLHCMRRAKNIVHCGSTKHRIAALDLPEPKFPRRKARKGKGRPSSSGGAASPRHAPQSETEIMRCTGHVTCCLQAVQQHLTGEGDVRATLDVRRAKRGANVKSPHSRPARRQAIWRRAVAAKKFAQHGHQCGCTAAEVKHDVVRSVAMQQLQACLQVFFTADGQWRHLPGTFDETKVLLRGLSHAARPLRPTTVKEVGCYSFVLTTYQALRTLYLR